MREPEGRQQAIPGEEPDLPANRWREIDQIFAAALARSPAERDAFVALSCEGDEELRASVQSLLDTAEEAEGFLEGSIVGNSPQLGKALEAAIEGDPLVPGSRVGAYRIVRELGRGGSGSVFVAERDDGHYERRIALKVLRRGLDTEDLVARFRAERQILASLSHPNIAALLDGGATSDGRPFLVMECVEGVPITQYSDAGRLGVRERLRLFLAVAGAVEYAHRNLVVHRDLKPSNILVAPDGTVKLLDFGIAKLLEPGGFGRDAPLTRTEVRLLTPEYASPEQVRGEPISTATDVYQLGLLLYELLTGRHAHRAGSAAGRTLERTVCDEEPPPPSAVVARTVDAGAGGPAAVTARCGGDVPGLSRTLRGDLDAIVLTALRKEPERRYASAERMAADVVAYLSGHAVAARRESRAYRTRKFVRRHPVGIAVAAAVALLLCAQLVIVSAYAQRLERERDRATLETLKAGQVRDFLVALFETADPTISGGETLTVPELLARGAARLEGLESQPELHAEVLDAMVGVYRSMRLHEHARPVYLRALEVYRSAFGEDDPRVADVLNELGHVERAIGTREAAARYYEDALTIRVRVFGPVHADVACSLNNLGIIAAENGDHDSAIRYYTNALDMRTSFVGPESPCVATILNNLALRHRATGDLDLAEELHRESLALRREALGNMHPDVAQTLNNLGVTLRRKGEPGEAEAAYREALHIYATVLGPTHPTVATGFNNIAVALNDQRHHAEAIALHRTALGIRRYLFGDSDPRIASSVHNLGTTLRDAGLLHEAAEAFGRALVLRQELLGDDHASTVSSREALEALRHQL